MVTEKPREINAKTVELIKKFEGLRLTSYRDAVGVWTIGYGHTSAAGRPLVLAKMVITEAEADEILLRDLLKVRADVEAIVDVPLNDNQFGALVSFVFNLGLSRLAGSTLLRLVNARAFEAVPAQFARWKYAGGRVLEGLVVRRAAEAGLWSDPT